MNKRKFLIFVVVTVFSLFVLYIVCYENKTQETFIISKTKQTPENKENESLIPTQTVEQTINESKIEEQIIDKSNEVKVVENKTKEIKETIFYKDSMIDTEKFNYDGECGDFFKYKENNERDLIFYSIYYKDEKSFLRHKEKSYMTHSINKASIPNAKRILYLYGDPPGNTFFDDMKNMGIEVIKHNKPIVEPFNAALHRFEAMYEYLIEHENEFDRVVHSDFRDVIWFADGFRCFSKDDMYITSESQIALGKEEHNTYIKSWINSKWMEEGYGLKFVRELKKNNSVIMNVGLAFGGTKQMINYLKIMVDEMNRNKNSIERWGYDQALINYLYYTNQLPNVTVIKPSQFIGFDVFSGLNYDSQNKVFYVKGSKCSPIIRHKICKDIKFMCDP